MKLLQRRSILFGKSLGVLALFLCFVPASAVALTMGGPGFAADKGDWTAAGLFGYRVLDFHEGTTFDMVKVLEFGGKVGYTPLNWWQLALNVGASSLTRSASDFKGDIMPNLGLQTRLIPIRKETVAGSKIALFLDLGGRWQPLSGTHPLTGGTRIEATGTLWEAVAGAGMSFCNERLCGYGGGRYSFFHLKESAFGGGTGTMNKHMGGVYAGVDYFVTPAVYFNLEAQNFDGDAIYIGVGGRF